MQNQNQNYKIKRKKKKKDNSLYKYLFLFICVFLCAFFGLKYVVDMYTPNAEIEIGNNEEPTLNYNQISNEGGQVDERLKWIQQEDELPSVGIRESSTPIKSKMDIIKNRDIDRDIDDDSKQKKHDEQKQKELNNKEVIKDKKAPVPNKINEIEHIKADFRQAAFDSGVIPKPTLSVSKVVIGNFSSLEEAVTTQNKINRENLNVSPFVKAVKNYYVVQVGSFSDREKAEAISSKLKEKGYSARVISEK